MTEGAKAGRDSASIAQSSTTNPPFAQSLDASQLPDDRNTRSPDEEKSLASATVQDLEGPWILLKVKALGELLPAAGKQLEEELNAARMPNEISGRLRNDFGVRLSELEISRYGAWLPHIRRDALRKAEQEAERNVQEAKQRMKRRRK